MKPVMNVVLMSLLLTSRLSAEEPHLIRYQGQAVDSQGVPLEGPYTLTFRLYDAITGGTKLWEETQPNVALQGGHFSVLLGQVTPLAGMDWSKPCWLSLAVGDEDDPEFSPRQRITSVPMAIQAEAAETAEVAKVAQKAQGLANGAGVDVSARVFNTAAISVPHATYTPLTFDSERWDTDAIHDTTTTTSRLTAKTAGKYLIYGHARFGINSSGHRQVGIRLNGSTIIGVTMVDATTSELSVISVATHYALAVNDYVELFAYQNSGGSISVDSATNHSPEFGMVKIP